MQFSIVTCTWNSQPFVKQAVESILNQDCQDFEIVFVDGGSTDGTLEYLRSTPGRVTIVENIRGGIARAMNAGIAASNGEVIAHLHSDDYYSSHQTLSRIKAAFQQSNAQWGFGRILSDVGGRELLPERYAVPRYSYRKVLMGNFIPHPATFIRRDVFDQYGMFDESLRFAMDYEYWLRIGRDCTPFQLDEHLAVFRRHAGSTTQANFGKSFNEDFRVRLRHAAWWLRPECALRYAVRRWRLRDRLAQ